MKEFNVNKGIIENDILNKARNNINIYFDFNKSKESIMGRSVHGTVLGHI